MWDTVAVAAACACLGGRRRGMALCDAVPPPVRALWVRALPSRYNANRAALVQSRIKALERMADVAVMEEDPEYIFRCAWRGGAGARWGGGRGVAPVDVMEEDPA